MKEEKIKKTEIIEKTRYKNCRKERKMLSFVWDKL